MVYCNKPLAQQVGMKQLSYVSQVVCISEKYRSVGNEIMGELGKSFRFKIRI